MTLILGILALWLWLSVGVGLFAGSVIHRGMEGE